MYNKIMLINKHLQDTMDFLKRFVGLVDLQHSQYSVIDDYVEKKEKEAVEEYKKSLENESHV